MSDSAKAEDVKPEPQAELQEIVVGSRWRFKPDDGDPFPNTRLTCATVLEVRAGWVRYRIDYCSSDTRRTLESFLYVYEPAGKR